MARDISWAGFVRTAALFLFSMGTIFEKRRKAPKIAKTFFGSETTGRLISTKKQFEGIFYKKKDYYENTNEI